MNPLKHSNRKDHPIGSPSVLYSFKSQDDFHRFDVMRHKYESLHKEYYMTLSEDYEFARHSNRQKDYPYYEHNK